MFNLIYQLSITCCNISLEWNCVSYIRILKISLKICSFFIIYIYHNICFKIKYVYHNIWKWIIINRIFIFNAEFNYDPQRHNVIIVDQEGHDSCKPASDAKKFQTGKDQIVLNYGKNFFICGVPTHCSDHGMKLEINVE